MTEVSTDFQGYLARRDKGVIQVLRAFLGLLVRTERGVMMERLGHGGCLESRDLEDSLALKARLVFLGRRESEAWTVPTAPKGAWDLKESQDLLDNRVLLGPRASPDLREPSVLMERRVLVGNQASLACLDQMDSRVTQGRKVPLEPKGTRAPPDHRVL